MKKKNTRFLIIFYFIICISFSYAQQNWPQWRGQNQNGISKTDSLPLHWSLKKNIKWKTALPSWSAATPIIWGNKIFIISPSEISLKSKEEQGADVNQIRESRRQRRAVNNPGGPILLLLCLSKENGKILWTREIDSNNNFYRKHNDSSPSPVTDGHHVWVVTGSGLITAFDMEGKPAWKTNLQKKFGTFGLKWGYASSPLLHKGCLVIEVLHGTKTEDSSYIISFNASNGKILWREIRKTDAIAESPDAYTTPIVIQHKGKEQIVISGADYVTGHDFKTGKEIWRAKGLNPYKRPNYRVVGTPVFVDGILYASTRKKPVLALKAGGKGDVSKSHLAWKYNGPGAPDVPSLLCDGKYLYMVDDGGRITCLDAKTGITIYGPKKTNPGIVSTSPILAKNRIYILNEKAVMTIIEAGKEFKILATNRLDGTYTLSSPAISQSNLFIRTSNYLYCIEEKKL